MPITKNKNSAESGLTLVELTISLAIVTLIAAGGYQMLVRTQKYAAQRKQIQDTQTEVDQLLAIIKKDWEYRTDGDNVQWPETGHTRLSHNNTNCGLGTPCPKLRVWLNRMIGNAPITDMVTFENICVRPSDKAVALAIASLNPASKLDTNCSTCPLGEVPAVKISGVDFKTNKVLLPAENRIVPANASDVKKIQVNGLIGMQACFTQQLNKGPISVFVRAMYRDQSGKGVKLIQKTQVYPFENFAKIRLEQ